MICHLCEHIPPQLQDFVFLLKEIPDITLYPFLLPVDDLLSGSTTIWLISHSPHPLLVLDNLQSPEEWTVSHFSGHL